MGRQTDPLKQEAKRLAALSARDRKAALDVHRRIADDPKLSDVTRQHARTVLEALETLIERIQNRKRT